MTFSEFKKQVEEWASVYPPGVALVFVPLWQPAPDKATVSVTKTGVPGAPGQSRDFTLTEQGVVEEAQRWVSHLLN